MPVHFSAMIAVASKKNDLLKWFEKARHETNECSDKNCGRDCRFYTFSAFIQRQELVQNAITILTNDTYFRC